ncbi:MAG: hypothetical protein CSB48_00590 [Proteobacteria bacterium]|nr:MAG: hypothetical protein CSB48_00590 [Pseudomonadota bacterium]
MIPLLNWPELVRIASFFSAGCTQSRQRYHHLQNSVKAYEKAYNMAKILYREGEGNFQNIIDTQRQLIDQQQTQIAEQGNISLAQISLIRSLGGGWVPE